MPVKLVNVAKESMNKLNISSFRGRENRGRESRGNKQKGEMLI
jgi:hypothetical protein